MKHLRGKCFRGEKTWAGVGGQEMVPGAKQLGVKIEVKQLAGKHLGD